MNRTGIWMAILCMLMLSGACACSDDADSNDGDADGDTDSETGSDGDSDTDSDTTDLDPPEIQPVGSCMVEQQGVLVCIAATGTDWTEALAEAHCIDTVSGAYSADPCPAENCAGICVPADDGEPGFEILYLFYTAQDVPLDMVCQSAIVGTWFPGCE